MHGIWQSMVVLGLITCFLQVQSADKYTDENRPYEFGFNIEGEQHRHEKKDENGLIMGEFGFITADGVYHVTVYATDENGKFRILSMKNIRVKPYPSGPGRKAPKSLQLPATPALPSPQAPASIPQTAVTRAPQAASTRAPFSLQTPVPSNLRSCSSCKIPTTTTTTPQPAIPLAPAASREQSPDDNARNQQPNYPQQASQDSSYPQQPVPQSNYHQPPIQNSNYPQQPSQQSTYPQQPSQQPNYPQQPSKEFAPPKYPEQTNFQQPQTIGQSGNVDGGLGFDQGPSGPSNYPQDVNTLQQQPQAPQAPGNRNPKQYQPNDITKPMLTYAQMQVVDKNTDVYARKPGEKEGLPPGITKDTMSTLLYTFNYTVGFHGHHEEGYANGAKKGYYYVTGRNGIRTRVDYEADENGFRPKITQEVLDLVSDEVPKAETEKDEKYGLKGYEFKWLYFPETKSR